MSDALAVADAERMAERFRALAEPARLQILHALQTHTLPYETRHLVK